MYDAQYEIDDGVTVMAGPRSYYNIIGIDFKMPERCWPDYKDSTNDIDVRVAVQL